MLMRDVWGLWYSLSVTFGFEIVDLIFVMLVSALTFSFLRLLWTLSLWRLRICKRVWETRSMLAYISSLLSLAWKTAPPFSTTVHSAIWESFFVVWEWFSSFEFLWTRRTTLVEIRPSTPSFSTTYFVKWTLVKHLLLSWLRSTENK